MSRRRNAGFVEKTLSSLAGAFEQAATSEEISGRAGLLQSLDPRVKVIGFLLLIVAAAASRSIPVILGILVLANMMALLSSVSIALLARRIWIPALIFTGAIALPALFITPGVTIAHLPVLGWRVTAQGLGSAAFLISRVLTSATLAITLILTTQWNHVLKSLRTLYVPTVFVVILGMTYRYIFVMLKTARDMFESRQSRTVGKLEGAEERRVATNSVGVLLIKSFQLSEDVYLAMQSRGFRGEVYLLEDFKMQPRDWVALAALACLAMIGLWLGR